MSRETPFLGVRHEGWRGFVDSHNIASAHSINLPVPCCQWWPRLDKAHEISYRLGLTVND